jgi:hypothetical protein
MGRGIPRLWPYSAKNKSEAIFFAPSHCRLSASAPPAPAAWRSAWCKKQSIMGGPPMGRGIPRLWPYSAKNKSEAIFFAPSHCRLSASAPPAPAAWRSVWCKKQSIMGGPPMGRGIPRLWPYSANKTRAKRSSSPPQSLERCTTDRHRRNASLLLIRAAYRSKWRGTANRGGPPMILILLQPLVDTP